MRITIYTSSSHFLIVRSLLAFVFLLLLQYGSGQTTHLIRGVDFEYLPDTVYMIEGDSIHFDPLGGVHNMTETILTDWLNNQGISNGGFDTEILADTTFVIDTAGTYYFVCIPHGFAGMKGVLIVDPLPTGIDDQSVNDIFVFPNPTSGKIQILSDQVIERVSVFDMTGRGHGIFESAHLDLSGLKSGVYLLRIEYEDKVLVRRVFKMD
jgi:plastocyanin